MRTYPQLNPKLAVPAVPRFGMSAESPNIRIGVFLMSIAVVCFASSGLCRAEADDRYLNAVREFADKVLECGRDVYGPKHTPLFVDGVNADTLEPVKWKYQGQEWIMSNLATQQNLFRVFDGLTRLTGDPKYHDAAVAAIRYAFANLVDDNGLLCWGGHAMYDAGGTDWSEKAPSTRSNTTIRTMN